MGASVGLLRACELLAPEYLVHMLKAVKHLSMSATLLEVLQNANAIDILVKILDEQSVGPYSAVRLSQSQVVSETSLLIPRIGNVKPCVPDLLQSLQAEQIKTRGSSAGRNNTKPQTSH